MGCISPTQVKKPHKLNKKKNEPDQTLYRSRIKQQNAKNSRNSVINEFQTSQIPLKSTYNNNDNKNGNYNNNNKDYFQPLYKIKPTTSTQFLTRYQITQTLSQSTKLQGPKLITNKIDGTVKVLHIYSYSQIQQQLLSQYQQLLQLQIYQDQQDNYLILDDYCTGPYICEILLESNLNIIDNTMINDEKRQKMYVYSILLQVYDKIKMFHNQKLFIGILNMYSFRKLSCFDDKIKLVDFGFLLNNKQKNNHNHNNHDQQKYKFAHAHSNSFSSDWQFFGYLLQYFLSPRSPTFIQHKMQYVQYQSYPNSCLVRQLLKGKQISRKQLIDIDLQDLLTKNNHVLYGYKFREDINKLIKMRKKRNKHKACYYGKQINMYMSANANNKNILINNDNDNDHDNQEHYDGSNRNIVSFYNVKSQLSQQIMYKIESQKILNNIQLYIQNLKPQCEQHFINYSRSNDNLRKLKEIFLIDNKIKKMEELKQSLHQIK